MAKLSAFSESQPEIVDSECMESVEWLIFQLPLVTASLRLLAGIVNEVVWWLQFCQQY
jgi:hypothetical protein